MSSPHGLLLIDKPIGCSSHHVVGQVRRILNMRAVGHAGTLDPIASGLLVLLIGEGTKISDYVLGGDKGYSAHVRLGVRTDTQDLTGTVLAEKAVHVTEAELRAQIEKLRGELSLQVPQYSAVKVAGQKLYEYAREGRNVELPTRLMNFKEVELVSFSENVAEVNMTCSKGSYVRAWADHLGEMLGTGAAIQALRRTWSCPYSLADAVTVEQLQQLVSENGSLNALTGGAYIPLAATLPLFPELRVTGRERDLIQNGQIANSLRGRLLVDLRHSSGRKILDEEGHKMLALVVSDASCSLSIRRVFHY